MIQLIIDTKDLIQAKKDLELINRDFPRLGGNIRRNLAARTKRLAKDYIQPKWGSTGRLKGSIMYRKEGTDRTDVIAQMPYAGYVELGTQPHKIKFPPNSKGDMLSRYWRTEIGKKHMAGSTRTHPGAKAMRFMEKAYKQMSREAEGIIGNEMNKFFRKRGW